MPDNREDIEIKEGGMPSSQEVEEAGDVEEEPTAKEYPAAEVENLKSELEKKNKEAKENHDKYLRAYAEFENYKKRAVKDQNEFLKFANEKLIKELLPAIDNLERAVEHAKGNSQKEEEAIKGLIAGVDLILKQFKDILVNFDVTELKSIGEPFDPARHEAVSHIETDEYADNIIINEFQKGYLLNSRLLRPALVSVAKKKEKKEEIKEEIEEE
ncbi:MAG: nucleotide exchange factor GrpE [Nitrospirae bacterium]|nr:nucleotide exchange factor GrpE [Nitrospirota bacterium]